jgi:hypothetical protein
MILAVSQQFAGLTIINTYSTCMSHIPACIKSWSLMAQTSSPSLVYLTHSSALSFYREHLSNCQTACSFTICIYN